MKIRLIDLKQDKEVIDMWCEQRHMRTLPNDYLSKFGFLVSKDTKNIAVCWLYPFMNTKRCMIDCMISNPNTTKQERSDAIDLLFMTIFLTAKDMGYEHITCTTTNQNIINKLLDLNFIKDDNHTYLRGEL